MSGYLYKILASMVIFISVVLLNAEINVYAYTIETSDISRDYEEVREKEKELQEMANDYAETSYSRDELEVYQRYRRETITEHPEKNDTRKRSGSWLAAAFVLLIALAVIGFVIITIVFR